MFADKLQLNELLTRNKNWASTQAAKDPEFFSRLLHQQRPEYLWIGCSDSRVPANELVNLLPGEMFVHRNIANQVIHTDFNCLSVLQFGIDVLQIKHIIVCGHYGCSGINAALADDRFGLVDNWLRHIQDTARKHDGELLSFKPLEDKRNRLCELNVIEQVQNVCQTTIVQDAWRRGQPLAVHGWIYNLANGLLCDLNISADGPV